MVALIGFAGIFVALIPYVAFLELGKPMTGLKVQGVVFIGLLIGLHILVPETNSAGSWHLATLLKVIVGIMFGIVWFICWLITMTIVNYKKRKSQP